MSRVTVCELGPPPVLRRISGWRTGNDGMPWMYVPLDPHASLDDVLDSLRKVPENEYYENAGVIFRAHPDEADALTSNGFYVDSIALRTLGRPLYLLRWDQSEGRQLIPMINGHEPLDDVAPLLADLRAAELKALVGRDGVSLAAHDDYHYAAPNGQHYARFVRASLAFQSLASQDAVAFWLLEHLSNDPIVVTDIGGMAGAALTAKRYAAALGLGSPGAIGAVEHPRSYGECTSVYLRHRLAALRERYESEQALVLLSVSDSGGTRDALLEACLDAGLDPTAVSLFVPPGYSCDDRESALAPLDDGLDKDSSDDCRRCRQGSVAVKLDESVFLMEVLRDSRAEILGADDVREVKEFCDRYREAVCLRVHRTEHDGRHHGIDIDVEQIVEHPAFVERMQAELAEWTDEVDLIISPTHAAAGRLACAAAALVGISEEDVLCIEETDLPSPDDPTGKRILESPRIMLVDDVTFSGTRVQRYREELNARGLMREGDNVRNFFGVARPSDPEALRGAGDTTISPTAGTMKAQSKWVEQLTLPAWDRKSCPWCRERELLAGLKRSLRTEDAIAERLAILEDEGGLAPENVFLTFSSAGTLSLGPGSFLGNRDPRETMICVASGIQKMRNEQRLRREHRFPVAHAVDIEESVKALAGEPVMNMSRAVVRYFEGIVQAAIIRACEPSDISNPITVEQLRRHVERALAGPKPAPRAAEYLLAMATEKLPRMSVDVPQEASERDVPLWHALMGTMLGVHAEGE